VHYTGTELRDALQTPMGYQMPARPGR
jgi:hypothetical protein